MKPYYMILAAMLALASCTKEIKLTGGTPDFSVTTDGTTFRAGEEVVFTFHGSAGLVSFYSGETFREYAYKDGRIVDGGPVSLSFTSAVTGGTQANQLAVMASTNFNGNYDFAGIQAATWTNITNRFLLGTNATFLASGVKDISDLVVAGQPLYLAYKYMVQPQTTSGVARSWLVQAVSMTSATSVGSLVLADMTNASFNIVRQVPDTSTVPRSVLTTTRITLLGNTFSPGNDPYHEIWAITKAIDPNKINVGPDRPVPLKGIADPALESYTYRFAAPGTYKVSFVAANINIDKSAEVVRQLDITITP